jgi:predicted alpha/beta hydrolase
LSSLSSSSSSVAATTSISLPLGTIHFEPHSSSKVKGGGAHQQQHFPISLASRLTLDILHSQTKVIDDVTVSYQGKARVCQVQVNFLALVRAAARHGLDVIQQDYRRIQESRPLLDHERAYLRCVQEAASL